MQFVRNRRKGKQKVQPRECSLFSMKNHKLRNLKFCPNEGISDVLTRLSKPVKLAGYELRLADNEYIVYSSERGSLIYVDGKLIEVPAEDIEITRWDCRGQTFFIRDIHDNSSLYYFDGARLMRSLCTASQPRFISTFTENLFIQLLDSAINVVVRIGDNTRDLRIPVPFVLRGARVMVHNDIIVICANENLMVYCISLLRPISHLRAIPPGVMLRISDFEFTTLIDGRTRLFSYYGEEISEDKLHVCRTRLIVFLRLYMEGCICDESAAYEIIRISEKWALSDMSQHEDFRSIASAAYTIAGLCVKKRLEDLSTKAGGITRVALLYHYPHLSGQVTEDEVQKFASLVSLSGNIKNIVAYGVAHDHCLLKIFNLHIKALRDTNVEITSWLKTENLGVRERILKLFEYGDNDCRNAIAPYIIQNIDAADIVNFIQHAGMSSIDYASDDSTEFALMKALIDLKLRSCVSPVFSDYEDLLLEACCSFRIYELPGDWVTRESSFFSVYIGTVNVEKVLKLPRGIRALFIISSKCSTIVRQDVSDRLSNSEKRATLGVMHLVSQISWNSKFPHDIKRVPRKLLLVAKMLYGTRERFFELIDTHGKVFAGEDNWREFKGVLRNELWICQSSRHEILGVLPESVSGLFPGRFVNLKKCEF